MSQDILIISNKKYILQYKAAISALSLDNLKIFDKIDFFLTFNTLCHIVLMGENPVLIYHGIIC